MTDRRLQENKGFTLLEMMILLLGLSCLTMLSLRLVQTDTNEDRLFTERYVFLQSAALLSGEHVSFDEMFGGGYDIEFGQNGYVKKAQTIMLNSGQTIVVELATGRLKERLSGD